MDIESVAKNAINEFKKKMLIAQTEALDACYLETLPHAESDLFVNVASRSESVINKILSGDFVESHRDCGVAVTDDNGITTHISIDTHQFDNLRMALVKAMPKCPKDLEIESLKLTIEHMRNNRFQ